MPEETAVVETEQGTAAEQDNSSQSKTTETQTGETQATETGEQTGEQGAEGEVKPEAKLKPGEKPRVKTPQEEAAMYKRLLEKKDRELAEAKTRFESSPQAQAEATRRTQEEFQKSIQVMADTLGISLDQAAYMKQMIQHEAQQIANQRVAPLSNTVHRSQYDTIKHDLSTDPDIVDFKSIEEDVDRIAHQYEVANQSYQMANKANVKAWALHEQGRKVKDLIKAAEERGKQTVLKNKRIEGEAGTLGTTVAGRTSAGGITQADKNFAAKQFITVEKARDIRLAREKALKEQEKQK